MQDRNDMNIPMISTVGLVSILLTIASVLAVQSLYRSYANSEVDRKVIQSRSIQSGSRLAEQEAALARFGWKDQSRSAVVIPIDLAMRLVVDDLNRPQESGGAIQADVVDEGGG